MTASISGYETPGLPIYTASKHGVIGLLRGAYRDLQDAFGIEINCVCPGPVATNIVSTFAARAGNLNPPGGREDYNYEEMTPDKISIAGMIDYLSLIGSF